MKGYIEGKKGNKYLSIVPTDESKDTIKKYEKLWHKIRDLIRSLITNNSNSCEEKYLIIKFNSVDNLPQEKH